MKKIALIFSVILVALLLTGCSLGESTKKYTVNGISVTMKDGFYEKELVSQTAYLESADAIFTALKEDFVTLAPAGLTKDSSLKDYAEAVKTANAFEGDLVEKDGLIYFTYEKEVSGKNFFYLASTYKSNDAFWLVNFACDAKNKETFEPKFIEWAKTVEFSK